MLRTAGAPDRVIAIALGVVPRTVARWQRGQHRPTPAHAYRLWTLASVVTIATGPLHGHGARS
jgi:hypothetical protein